PCDHRRDTHHDRDARYGAHHAPCARRFRGLEGSRFRGQRRGAFCLFLGTWGPGNLGTLPEAAVDGAQRRRAHVASCDSMAKSSRPDALMSPAPKAMTMSPGLTSSRNFSATFFLSGTKCTSWCPWARIASASDSPVTPGIGFSPAG